MADAHVRPARVEDAAELGRIQAATWAVAYGHLLPPEALATVTPDAAAAAWAAAIGQPPSPRHRVLTAYERTGTAGATSETTVGFAAVAPAEPDESGLDEPTSAGELVALLVEPRWGRRGHGSRLLAAAVDLARADGVTVLLCWVLDGDAASETLLTSAGWARDGWTRGLQTGAAPLQQHRLVADIRR